MKKQSDMDNQKPKGKPTPTWPFLAFVLLLIVLTGGNAYVTTAGIFLAFAFTAKTHRDNVKKFGKNYWSYWKKEKKLEENQNAKGK